MHSSDLLQAFVDVVKRNVTDMEEMVQRAETEVGSISPVKKVFQLLKLPLFGAAVSNN